MKEQCYKFISKNELQSAPKRLSVTREIDGEMRSCINLSPSEKVYNAQGYYRRQFTPMPDDGYQYTSYWDEATPDRPYHLQCWEQGEKIEPVEKSLTDIQIAFNTLNEKVQQVTTLKGMKEAIDEATALISEVSTDG